MRRTYCQYLILFFGAFCIISCFKAPVRSLNSLKKLKKGEVLLVGRISLYPELDAEKEQYIPIRAMDRAYLIFSHTEYRMSKLGIRSGFYIDSDGVNLLNYKKITSVPLNETFYLKAPAKEVYLVGIVIPMYLWGYKIHAAYLPGGLKLEIEPGDKALYMGTISYERDEFFGIVDASVQDEYLEAKEDVRETFEQNIPMRKWMAFPVDPETEGSSE